jgi:hypothetical protein
MSDEEKRETENKKRKGSRHGHQYVTNTVEATQARKGSQPSPLKAYDGLSVEDVRGRRE